MRRVFSIILYVIAGFFLCSLALMGFINVPEASKVPEMKWIMVIIFLVIAAIPLLGGLAIMRFRNWKRETGVVLLSAMAFTAFELFTLATMFMSEEFRATLPQESLDMFSDYITGGAIFVALVALGFMLFRAETAAKTQAPGPESEDPAIQV